MPPTDLTPADDNLDPPEPQGERWEPPMTNAPAGTIDTATVAIESALKSHDDAIRTHSQLQREAEPPKCIITQAPGNWSWSYASQHADGFTTKEAVLEHARSNLVPLLDANDEPLNVIYEVVQS